MPSTLARGRTRPWRAAAALALALTVAGCASSTSDAGADGSMSDGAMSDDAMSDGTTSGGAQDMADAAPLSETNPALDFSAVDLDGMPVTGVEGPVVLWFWAPWCPICRGEAPALVKEVEGSPGVTFIGVASRDELPAMKAFVSETGVGGFQHLADVDGEIWARFGVTAQPAMAFISSDGQVKVVPGALAPQDVIARTAELE
jgi:thiol-disulfide isomerase/thioredoxin